MANRYWVGSGLANWNTTNTANWSTTSGGAGGASVPTAADDVFFDANSSASNAAIITGVCRNLDTAGYTGTWLGATTSNTLSIYGSCTLSAGMTQSAASTVSFYGTGTLTTNGKSFNTVTIETGATVTLGSALTVDAQLTVNGGTLNTSASNYSVTTPYLSAGGSTARTLTFNGSTVTVTGTGGAFDFSGSNLTFNGGTSTVVLSGGAYMYAYFGNKTFYNLSFTNTNTADWTLPTTIYDGFTVSNTLTFSAPSSVGSRVILFNYAATYTIGTLVAAGSSPTQRILFGSNATGRKATLTVTTYTTKQYIDFVDIAAAGTSAPWSGTSVGFSNVTNITGSAAKTVYWNGGSLAWTGNGWAASSGGAPATANFPLMQDTAVFDNAGSAGTVTMPNVFIPLSAISSAGRTSAMTMVWVTDVYAFGNSYSFGTGISFSGGGIGGGFRLRAQTVTTLTMGGQSFPLSLRSDGAGLLLGSAFTSSYVIQMSGLDSGSPAPSFNTGGYNVTADRFVTFYYIGNTTYTLSSSTLTFTGTVGWDMTGTITMNAGTSNIVMALNTAGTQNFQGAGKTYNKLTYGGSTASALLNITDANTFAEITSTRTIAGTITFAASTTTTVSAFTVSGASGNLITINSSSAGTPATLSKSTGAVSVSYLSIQDSTATGGATWYASNSTDGGNNTGWIFSAPPSTSGNFLTFFM